jgi:hypothetical protein
MNANYKVALPRTKVALLALAAQLFMGCDSQGGGTPETAKGDTNIRYVICDIGDTNCFVAARFKSIDSCESHKRWSEMLCDSRAEPGKMVCTPDTGTQVSVSYCTL